MPAKMRYSKYLHKIHRTLPHKKAASMGKSSFPELSIADVYRAT